MEKTTQITIASTGFSLTEAAYEKISRYLESLKAHFAGTPEKDEIMRDIEGRIAEKLLHKRHQVITEDDITAVTTEIGDASEFDENESSEEKRGSRRLYRDTDAAWIGGVASGLGAYFDIDPLWPRLIFLASIFFGGSGILVYVVLWMLIPEAASVSQKLEMRGHAVDLGGIVRVVKENVQDVRESRVVPRIFGMLRRVISMMFRALGKVAGSLFVIGSFFAIMGLLVGVGIVATNWTAPYNDFPLRGVVHDGLIFGILAAGFVAILIPLIAVFALGIRLVRKKTVVPGAIAFGLIGIWALAVSAAGTMGVRAAGDFFEYTRTAPEYRVETTALELSAFTGVSTKTARVTIKTGEQSVEVHGRAVERENTIVEVVDGVLVVSRKDYSGTMCIFCNNDPAEVIITTPDLDSVAIEGGSIWFDDYTDTDLSLEMRYGAMWGTLTANSLDMRSDGGSFNLTLASDTLSIDAEDTRLELDGSADSATISIEDTFFNAERLRLASTTLQAFDSYGTIHAAELEAVSDENSRIVNVATRTLAD